MYQFLFEISDILDFPWIHQNNKKSQYIRLCKILICWNIQSSDISEFLIEILIYWKFSYVRNLPCVGIFKIWYVRILIYWNFWNFNMTEIPILINTNTLDVLNKLEFLQMKYVENTNMLEFPTFWCVRITNILICWNFKKLQCWEYQYVRIFEILICQKFQYIRNTDTLENLKFWYVGISKILVYEEYHYLNIRIYEIPIHNSFQNIDTLEFPKFQYIKNTDTLEFQNFWCFVIIILLKFENFQHIIIPSYQNSYIGFFNIMEYQFWWRSRILFTHIIKKNEVLQVSEKQNIFQLPTNFHHDKQHGFIRSVENFFPQMHCFGIYDK